MACQRRWTKLTVALYWVLMKRNMNLPNDFSDVSWCLFALFVSKNSWRFLQFSLMRKCSLNITQKPCSPIQLYSSQSQTYCRRRNCLYTLQVFCIEPRTSGLMIYNSYNSFVDRWLGISTGALAYDHHSDSSGFEARNRVQIPGSLGLSLVISFFKEKSSLK